MPTWLVLALPYLTQAPSIATGLVHLGQAIATEIASDDSVIDKAAKVAGELARHASDLEAALVANTAHA